MKEGFNGTLLVVGVVPEAGDDDSGLARPGLDLDGLDDLGEERVGDVRYGDADGGIPTAAERDGEHVRHVLQVVDGRIDPVPDAVRDVAVVVQHTRDGLGADTGTFCHLAHRGHGRSPPAIELVGVRVRQRRPGALRALAVHQEPRSRGSRGSDDRTASAMVAGLPRASTSR